MPYPPFASLENSFTAHQQAQGDNSFPGQQLDTDLANLAEAVDTLNEFVRGVTRSDGEVGNQTIGHDQLKPELSIGFKPPVAWEASTYYAAATTMFSGLAYYRATADHTSSVSLDTDLGAGLWEVLIDFEPSLSDDLPDVVEPIVEALAPGIVNDTLAQVPAVVEPLIEAAIDATYPALNPYAFGAAGDGVADDYPSIQAMLDAAASTGTRVHFPAGVFKLTSGSPKVSSNTVVTGEGKGKSILVQPNYFSYDRGTDPYVKGDVVDWNALWMDVGTENVDISGIELRGPFWQPDDAGYTSTPVENWPASNGIHVRGADYQWRQGLSITGESFNIRIHDCHLEGWAEDAIQCDMVTHLWVERNTIARCGRGGFRGYSCVHAWVQHNSIDTLSPGDYLNNGNRMYGIEFTRTYQSGVRTSSDFWVIANRVRNCLQWKGMGTHGGQRGNFLYNDIIDCHHGIGVDKGGFDAPAGISPPRDIKIIGNRILRAAAGDVTEGNGEGGAGHAIFVTAHDGTSTHLGHHLVVSDNICEGWGCENLNGGAWIGNWAAVTIGPNVWRNCFGTAIRLRDTIIALNLGPQTIRGVTRSAAGNQRGIGVEASTVTGIIGPQMIENVSATELTAVYLANSSSLVVQDGHALVNTGGGSVKECNIPANDLSGPMTIGAMAVARVNVGGDDSVTVAGHRNVVSAERNSEGTFTVTLARAGSSTSTIFPIAAGVDGSFIGCQAIAASTSTVTVLTKDAAGTLTDSSFMLHVFGY